MIVIEYLNSIFSGLDLVFFLMAVVGGLALAVRMALLMFGIGDHDGDFSGADGGDIDHGGMHEAGDSLQFLSIQGLMGFFLMFGLVGLAMHRGSGLDETISIIGGFAAGVVMLLLIAKMMQMLYRLQSTGNLNLTHAVGHIGTVYLTIPEEGTGQVQLTIDGRMRIYDAVTADKKEVKTGERVEVAEIIDGRILVVKKS
jgi:membrane protein implicated in regulation of membrane protease activity